LKKLSIAAVEKLTCRHLHFYLHAPFRPREQLGSLSESPIYQATPQAQGASGSPGDSCLLSVAATITMRMGHAAVGAAPAGGKVTDSMVITE
jgi:hypothetical protein